MAEADVNPEPTRYPELNGLLHEITEHAVATFGADLVGVYVQGSFALGAGDEHSDCDFLVVVRRPPSPAQEAAVRRLHDEIPTRPGHWPHDLEGSYPVADELRSLDGLGKRWLFVDHGHREMEWDDHCNNEFVRWITRNHGIRVFGPAAADLVDPLPSGVVRERARAWIPTTLPGIESWCSLDLAWGQRYAVVTVARLLYSLVTDRVASKGGALDWALEHVDSEWHKLLVRARRERARGWDPHDKADAAVVAQTRAFADYVTRRSAGEPSALR